MNAQEQVSLVNDLYEKLKKPFNRAEYLVLGFAFLISS